MVTIGTTEGGAFVAVDAAATDNGRATIVDEMTGTPCCVRGSPSSFPPDIVKL